jgi:hypothetical protein
MSASDPNEKFRTLLEKIHSFPTKYIHKVIGKNSNDFKASLEALEIQFKGLLRTSEKTSANQAHLAITYDFDAKDPEAVIALTVASHKIKDLLFIL